MHTSQQYKMTDPKVVLKKLQASLAKPHMEVGWAGSHWLGMAIEDCQKLIEINVKKLDQLAFVTALVEVNGLIDELAGLKVTFDKLETIEISFKWKLAHKHAEIKHDLYNRKGLLTAYLSVL